MKKNIYIMIYFLISLFILNAGSIYLIPIKGDIDMGLPYFIERGVKEAELNDAEVIIFDISGENSLEALELNFNSSLLNLKKSMCYLEIAIAVVIMVHG